MRWDETLRHDAELKEQVENFIRQLETPFGFLNALATEHAGEANGQALVQGELDPAMSGAQNVVY